MKNLARILWVGPCSLLGLLLALIVLLAGGKWRPHDGTLEITLRDRDASLGPLLRALRFGAITLGHIIVALTREELDALRDHERVHVRQYERWGGFFFFAYAGSSAWQLLRGRRAYWDNHFEVDARMRSAPGRNSLRTPSPR